MGRSGARAGSASALIGLGAFLAGALVSPLSGMGQPAVVMAGLMAVASLGALAASEHTARRGPIRE